MYGSLILAGSYCCILEPEENVHPTDYPYLDDDLGVIDGRATPVIPETIGQFTGLIDGNGTKIFEGDITKNKSQILTRKACKIVEWVNDSCGFEPFSDSLENCGHCGGGLIPEFEIVVGNIHDNPELLERL